MPTQPSDRGDPGVAAEPGVLQEKPLRVSLSLIVLDRGDSGVAANPRRMDTCYTSLGVPIPTRPSNRGDSCVAAEPGVLQAGKSPFGPPYPAQSCQTRVTRV